MNNELFTLKPNLKQYYGRTIHKDTKFNEYTSNKEVHQTLENLKLKTEINREYEINKIKVKEHSVVETDLLDNSVLIWNEIDGYILPNVPFYKLKDLEKEIKAVKKVYKDNTDINS